VPEPEREVVEPVDAVCLVVGLAFTIRLVTRGAATPTLTIIRRPVAVAA